MVLFCVTPEQELKPFMLYFAIRYVSMFTFGIGSCARKKKVSWMPGVVRVSFPSGHLSEVFAFTG